MPKLRVRLGPGNPSEAERNEHNATHLPFRATQPSQFRLWRARNADGLLLHAPKDGERLLTVEEQMVTMQGRLEQVLTIEVNITDPLGACVVRHASWLLNRYRVKHDGIPRHQRKATMWVSGRALSGLLESAKADETEVRRPRASSLPDPWHRRPAQHRWNSQKMKDLVVTAWRMIQNRTILTEARLRRRYIACAMLQKHGPYP